MNFTEEPQVGSGSTFIKLKDKESVMGIFKGDIHVFYVKWENGRSKECDKDDEGAKFRFRVNFVVKDGDGYTAKIMEQGAMVYNDLKSLHDEYDLEETVVKMTRNGSGTDTKYNILPVKKQPDAKTFKIINSIALNELDPKKKDDETPNFDSEDSDLPF